MLQLFRDIAGHREFLREHALLQLRSRYRGSVLGFLWTLLNPLFISLAFVFIFSKINHVAVEDFLPHFLSGYLPWIFFATTLTMATNSIVGNAGYVTRVYVPKGVFPLSLVLVNAVDLLAGFAIYFGLVAVAFPQHLSIAALFLPVSLIILFAFTAGMALLFATINVFFRDFQFIWGTISFVWFFLLPILFLPQNMPDQVRSLNVFNVMYPFIRLFQDPLAHGTLPPPEIIGISALYAGVALIIGSVSFFRWQREFYMYV